MRRGGGGGGRGEGGEKGEKRCEGGGGGAWEVKARRSGGRLRREVFGRGLPVPYGR